MQGNFTFPSVIWRACCLCKAFNLSKSHMKGRQVLPWWVPYTCNYYCQHYYQQWHFYFIGLRWRWGSAHCPYHLHVLLATQTSSLEKSTVSTSKWDPQAADKSYHQPQNKAVKKKILTCNFMFRKSVWTPVVSGIDRLPHHNYTLRGTIKKKGYLYVKKILFHP